MTLEETLLPQVTLTIGDEIYLPDFGWCEVTNLFGHEGEEIDVQDGGAVSAVAQTPKGQWVAILLRGDVTPLRKN